jgi:hypothetical protein
MKQLKLSLCTPPKDIGDVDIACGNEWSTGRPSLQLGMDPRSNCIVGCVGEGVRTGLDDMENRQISCLCRDSISELSDL